MRTDLTGKTVVITGASGGIGAALVDAFAAEGAGLALLAHGRVGRLEQQVAARSWPAPVRCADADVRDAGAVDRAFEQLAHQLGRLDVCIINAGIWPEDSTPLHRMEPDRIREVTEINLLGALFTARAFLRQLARVGPRPDGHGASLLLIGSTAGRFGEPGHVEYAASKAALRGIVLTLKSEIVELDPWGRVNLIEPGWTVTPMARATLEQPGVLERVLATSALAQVARPEDVARIAVALASPSIARHVTGEILTVSGGMEGRLRAGPIDLERARARLDPDPADD